MTVAVLGGSGQMGRVAVRSLRASGIPVVVADRQPPADPEPGVEFRPVDASDQGAVRAALDGVDAVMNFVGPYYRFGPTVVAAAIDAGLPYIDVCDDADVTVELLGLDDRARAAGVAVVTGAGGGPGVVNLLARIAAADFTRVDRVLTAWALEPGAEGSAATVAHTIHCVADPYPTWRDGALVEMRALDDPEPVLLTFPDPVGDVRVRNIGHPEPVTLGRVIGAGEVRALGGIIPDVALDVLYGLVRLGMGSTRPIPLGDGHQVSPRDFLAAYLAHQGTGMDRSDVREKVGLAIRVTGARAGEPATRHLTFAAHATLADSTAVPAVAGLDLLRDGQVPPGVHGPEALDPAGWLSALDRLRPDLYDVFHLADGDDGSAPQSLTTQGLRDLWEASRRSAATA